MITIKNLKWNNWFSYGDNNEINFDSKILQITGKNGSGKTSIPLILQEVYYGKNSKGKKKASLPNRNISNPTVYAESEFESDQDTYKIILSRKSNIKLKLLKNGEEISSHTTTNTYKTIQNIIGLDFKTFAQLTYQSSTDYLEFLSSTDTNRKKFLINLFSLSKYLEILESFKSVYTDLNSEISNVKGKLSTIESWIKKHNNIPLEEQVELELPKLDDEDITKLGELQNNLKNIKEKNKKINQNNQYKQLLENLDTSILFTNIQFNKEDYDIICNEEKELSREISTLNSDLRREKDKKRKIEDLDNKCHSCYQDISIDIKNKMVSECNSYIEEISSKLTNLKSLLEKTKDKKVKLEGEVNKLTKRDEVNNELVRLKNNIDESLQEDVLNAESLSDEILEINKRIKNTQAEIERISNHNSKVSSHNSKVKVIREQLKEYAFEQDLIKAKLDDLNSIIKEINIIKKAFSPNGLLSYKLEFLVKDLEKEINIYLSNLSKGRFQLLFKLEKEKLNIRIIDNGNEVGIEDLSAGEKAKINAATLLSIRKLMSAISTTKINILFLDEIMGVLDETGKEELIEVLNDEVNLNTLLVSHEYSHPLIPQIKINKNNNISNIEYI